MNRKSKRIPLPDAFWFQEGPGIRNWQFMDTGIKLLNVANITKTGDLDLSKTNRYLDSEEVKNRYSHFLCDEGDLVIASSGISFDEDGLLRTRGAFVKKEHLPLCMNTSTIRFKSKTPSSNINYLYYWLDSYEFRNQISRGVTGSAQQNFGPMQLKNVYITMPEPDEQQQIVDILSKADRLRRLRRQARQLADGYLQSVFLEMFGDPVSNPMKFPLNDLRSLSTKFSDGPFGSNLKTEHYVSSGIRVVRLQNIGIGEFLDDDKVYITESHFHKLAKHTCLSGDVIVGTLGNPNLRATILPDHINIALNKADCVQIRLNPLKATSEFICWLLNMPQILSLTRSMIHGQTRDRISMSQLAAIEVPIPKLIEQNKFSDLVRKFTYFQKGGIELESECEQLNRSHYINFFGNPGTKKE